MLPLAAQAALQEAVVEDERFHPLASNRRGVEEDGEGMTHVEHAVILTAFHVAAQVRLSAPRSSDFRVGRTYAVLGSMKGWSNWAQEATRRRGQMRERMKQQLTHRQWTLNRMGPRTEAGCRRPPLHCCCMPRLDDRLGRLCSHGMRIRMGL